MRLSVFACCFYCMAYIACAGCISAQGTDVPEHIVSGEQADSYLKAAAHAVSLYTGKMEPGYTIRLLNHPYLDTDDYRTGLLSFEGILYPDVPMRLNLHQEELVVLSPDRRFSVVVPRDRLDYAQIDSLFIVYGKPDIKGGDRLPEGYYVRMHHQKYQVWKHELKLLNSDVKGLSVANSFERRVRYYVYKDEVIYPVNSEKSLLDLFLLKKKDLKRLMKQQGLNFKKNPDRAIVCVTDYCETLNR